jgi:hypothetical protein
MTSAPRRGSAVLLGLSLGWLGWLLWSAQSSVVANSDPLGALIAAAAALPVVISASLLSGTAAGLAALAWRPVRGGLRWPLAIGAGALVGAVTAGLIFWGYGHRSSIMLLAFSVLAAGAVGGALAAVNPGRVVFVGSCAALAAFVVESALALFTPELNGLFGAGTTAGTRLAAASRLALTSTLLGGLVAGGLAFWLLHRARCGWRFPAYPGAGATAGILLLLTELITRIGGAQLFDTVGRLSPADRTFVSFAAQSRLSHALMVLFVGAIVALLCFGSTLRRPEPAPDRTPEPEVPAKLR